MNNILRKILLGTLITFILYFALQKSLKSSILKHSEGLQFSSNKQDKDKIITELSLLLNQASNKIGKLSCELSDNVSENGGWCSKISGKNSPQHLTDIQMAIALSEYLKGKRVASFGDGPGK
jgi:hypothetical protein